MDDLAPVKIFANCAAVVSHEPVFHPEIETMIYETGVWDDGRLCVEESILAVNNLPRQTSIFGDEFGVDPCFDGRLTNWLLFDTVAYAIFGRVRSLS